MADQKPKKKEGFGHSLWLLLRAMLNIFAFLFLFYSLSSKAVLLIVFSSILLALCVMLNVVLPLMHMKKY